MLFAFPVDLDNCQYQLLSCAYNKILDEINLRKEGFTFALEGTGSITREGCGGTQAEQSITWHLQLWSEAT